jgi:hypothetical protein
MPSARAPGSSSQRRRWRARHDRRFARRSSGRRGNIHHGLEGPYALPADLRQLRTDLSGLGADGIRAARAGIAESARNAATKGKAAAELAEKQITAHPFLSIAACFAIGLLLGMRLNRRD